MRDARPAAVAAALLLAFGAYWALAANVFLDLFIFRTAAQLALRADNPYHIPAIRAAVAGQYPDDERLIDNCGFFMPPGALVGFFPLALLPWQGAKLFWVALGAFAAFAVGRTVALFRPAGRPPVPGLIGAILPFLLVLNFLVLAVVMVGQTPLIAAGCVVAGLAAFGRGWNTAGAVLWALPFAKPHVALGLLPLAWYLGGGELSLIDYVQWAGAGHKAVAFNRAELAYEMTSWNRLLYVASGGRWLVEQSAPTILVSYAVGFALVFFRCAAARTKPSEAWALAMAAALSVVCPQVLAYELVGLVLAVPWVRDLFASGHRTWGLAAVALLGAQLIPFQTADALGIDWHRPAGAMAFALVVLFGPLRPARGLQ